MTSKRFYATVCHIVEKQTGMALKDVDADFDPSPWFDDSVSSRRQLSDAVDAANEVLETNGWRDDNPAMTAGLVANVMNHLVN